MAEYWKYAWPIIATLDHFEGLFEHLEQRNMLPDFLAHGEMALVRRAMAEADDSGEFQIEKDFILDAISLCIKEDKYERATDLMKAEQERHANDYDFDEFMYDLFERFIPESGRASLKRFLTLHGKQFGEKYPDIFEAFCEKLAFASNSWYSDPSTKEAIS